MLNIKQIRESPEYFKRGLERRKLPPSLIDKCIELDAMRRRLITSIQELRHLRNVKAEEVGRVKKSGGDVSHLIREMETINIRINELEIGLKSVENELYKTLISLPTVPHESVPDGETADENVVLRVWGESRAAEFVRDHVDLLKIIGGADIERAAKVSGARFYYLYDKIVLLNYALINYALDFLSRKGFRLVQPPYMLRREVMESVMAFADFKEMIYKIEDEELYLIGTAEHPLAGLHADEILDGRMLPLRYAGVSPCFRREAGAHGKDTKGIFRVHQFEKVEQFIFCKPSQSWDEHEFLLQNAEEIYRSLGLPYRVVNICVGDLGPVAAKKYDIEVWMPAMRAYKEIVSCSNCLDYQAMRLNIRYREEPHDEETHYVHTLNSTAIATERTIVAILENYQLRDGSIEVPEALRPYMRNESVIRPARS
ncbi:MAG: serine--tRNA ligase [Aigarchaeota archaeon]|nr:serine--tRNA ligase [Aigarchaeota archaeon]MDW8092889.1 serine--tRNA ligase [Nitrososphaerota archaeon]